MYNLSNICKAANELTKKGFTKSDAFRQAWMLAKNIISKVSGVSFGKRSAALERLTHYSPEQISVQLLREDNQYDGNAVAVIAAVEGKGSYCVGYVPATLSRMLAAVMDAGAVVKAKFNAIVGGCDGLNYGMRIALAI